MKINFVSHASETLASHRMRVLKPVELLNKAGLEASWSSEADSDANVVVFQKHMNPQYDLFMMLLLRDTSKIVFDICDDHFDGNLAGYYKEACSRADVVTVNSKNLQERVKQETGIDAVIVKDPITFPHKPPLTLKDKVINPRLLWFGHASNIGPLEEIAYKVEDPLTIISNIAIDSQKKLVDTRIWEPNLVEDVIDKYSFVLIPLAENKQNKNTNRAVDALVSGRFVIADSERVYGELKDFIWIGDILEGIEWAKNNPEEVIKKVKLGQEYVMEAYGDAVISSQWIQALTDIKDIKNG